MIELQWPRPAEVVMSHVVDADALDPHHAPAGTVSLQTVVSDRRQSNIDVLLQ
jgi:hypothetical protein